MENIDLKQFDKKYNFKELFSDLSKHIYTIIFYLAGLLLGALLYKSLNMINYSETLKKIFEIQTVDFLQIFISKLGVTMSLYSFTILLGLCIFGFPVINALPFIVGMETSIKLSYFYIQYSIKGIAYSILMVVPETVVIVEVMILSIYYSKLLSKKLFDIAAKKESSDIELSSFMKKFIMFGLIVAGVTALNSLLIYLLNPIIKI